MNKSTKPSRKRIEKAVHDFFNKYPTIEMFKRCKYSDIFKILYPLGLKKRIKYLCDIANHFSENNVNKIPDNKNDLMKIKGIGNYTANAILCFAFDKKIAIVDWTIARLLNRIWNVDITRSPHNNKKLLAFAQELLPNENVRRYNWALLDFAALICKPRSPKCSECPMADICEFYKMKKRFKIKPDNF